MVENKSYPRFPVFVYEDGGWLEVYNDPEEFGCIEPGVLVYDAVLIVDSKFTRWSAEFHPDGEMHLIAVEEEQYDQTLSAVSRFSFEWSRFLLPQVDSDFTTLVKHYEMASSKKWIRDKKLRRIAGGARTRDLLWDKDSISVRSLPILLLTRPHQFAVLRSVDASEVELNNLKDSNIPGFAISGYRADGHPVQVTRKGKKRCISAGGEKDLTGMMLLMNEFVNEDLSRETGDIKKFTVMRLRDVYETATSDQ